MPCAFFYRFLESVIHSFLYFGQRNIHATFLGRPRACPPHEGATNRFYVGLYLNEPLCERGEVEVEQRFPVWNLLHIGFTGFTRVTAFGTIQIRIVLGAYSRPALSV